MTKKLIIITLLIITYFTPKVNAQTPGLIYKPAGTGAAVLDPNGDGYSSQDTFGFISNDETESEIPYTPLPVLAGGEPDSDLGPGPDCGFTDLVKSADNETIYTYSDGTNLFYRFRLGGTASNSKGYSILLDTDQKFGFTGPNADPNAVTGNPGFEIEIILMTNFGVGLYDIDGTTTPTEMGSATTDRPFDDYAQKSIALTDICGDDDYFYDFYIPWADISSYFPSVNSATPLRMVGMTVINPNPAIGNNGVSDLGGIDDALGITDALWEDLIDVFPPTSGDDLAGGGEVLPRAECPAINGPIAVGATAISGTSTEADGTTITVFKDGVSVGTTTTSGGTWTLSGLTALASNQIITSTAILSGVKSTSIDNCSTQTVGAICSNPPTSLAVLSGTKGISGLSDAVDGSTVTLYAYNTGTSNWDVWGTSTVATGAWSVSCGTGNCLPPGAYYATVQAGGECESIPSAIICHGLVSSTAATITVTTPPTTTTTTSITGTLAATPATSAVLELYINDIASGFTTTTSTTSWIISGISGLAEGDNLTVYTTESGLCPVVSTNSVTVQTQSVSPIIVGSYCTNTTITTISGISPEPVGALITLYSSGVSPVT
ncbi:MAG: hypothetical protein OEX02_05560, partial [Cyclobacteriaceae bacterium]|nr:hypothetical protein [Cyclobacteriaceae bacterium]